MALSGGYQEDVNHLHPLSHLFHRNGRVEGDVKVSEQGRYEESEFDVCEAGVEGQG